MTKEIKYTIKGIISDGTYTQEFTEANIEKIELVFPGKKKQ